jgi:hypothetical protein
MKLYRNFKIFPNIIVLIYIFSFNLFGDDGLLFKPLIANPYEGRIGSIGDFKDKRLRLDIGTTFDLMSFPCAGSIAAIGADFFTYTRLRSEGNFKFPVETSDYYFGVNYSMNLNFISERATARVRLAHISSHLVDGYTFENKFLKEPFVYSREFLDITFANYYKDFRYYLGVNYVFSTKPKAPDPFIPQLGIEYDYRINPWLAITMGYDFKLVGVDGKYASQNAIQAGLTFYTSSHYGIFVGAYYFSGRSIHGEFYNELDNYPGIGFQVMHW